MRPEQFSHRIGNIEDLLITQSENVPKFSYIHRKRNLRRIITAAAAIALMVCSFMVGAAAFSKEPNTVYIEREPDTVYIEKQQEIISIGDSGISLILPDNWAGKYGYDMNGNCVTVYSLAVREEKEWATEGVVFSVEELDGLYPMDYSYVVPGHTIATIADKTYAIFYASDVQYPPDNEAVAEEYLELFRSARDIQILLTDWLKSNSENAANWIEGTAYIYKVDDGEVIKTVKLDKENSDMLANIIDALDYNSDEWSFVCDISIALKGEVYLMNSATGKIINSADPASHGSATLSMEELKTVMALLE